MDRISLDAFLAGREVERDKYSPEYFFRPGRVIWSADGKRLLLQVGISSTYVWGQNLTSVDPGYIRLGTTAANSEVVPPTRTLESEGPIRIPAIHFDCIIILNAE